MTTQSNPAEYAKNHWRKFESNEDHAERVERAEHTAGRYFESATVRQKAAYDTTMADLRGLDAPRYTRARNAANAEWTRSTTEAADLYTITCDSIMVHGEVPEEIGALWDELDARQAAASKAREAA